MAGCVLNAGVVSVAPLRLVALSVTSCRVIGVGKAAAGGAAGVNVVAVPPAVTARLTASKVVLPNVADAAVVIVVMPCAHACVTESWVRAPLVMVKRNTCRLPDAEATVTVPV